MADTIESLNYDSLVEASPNNLEASSYNDSYNELAFEYGQTAFTKKLLNTALTMQQKTDIVKHRMLYKETDLEGFESGEITLVRDGDSGRLRLSDGSEAEYRLVTVNHFDTTDKLRNAKASTYKWKNQPKVVSALTDKANPTDIDFENVANYQHNEMLKSLTNSNHAFAPYDKNTIYTKDSLQQPIQVRYRVTGIEKDENGNDRRLLIEAINPSSMRDVAFDASLNPYLNDSFDLFKSINTQQNKERIRNYSDKNKGAINAVHDIVSKYDTDNWISEDFDIIQSSAYQSWARVLNNLAPESWIDKSYWATVANPTTGEAIADAWAGVKTSTRRALVSEMLQIDKAFEEGRYTDGIKGMIKNLDTMFAQSAVQSAANLTGVIATGVAAASGVGLPAAIAALIGAATAAGDQTLSTMEQYKVNNNGKEMSGTDIATNFAINTALMGLDSVLIGMNALRFLPKPISKAITKIHKDNTIVGSIKNVGASSLGEGIQEGAQGIVERSYSQNENNAQSLSELVRSHDTLVDIAAGAVMGGALSGTATSMSLPLQLRQEKINNATRDAIINNNEKVTPVGTVADVEVSNTVASDIDKVTTDKTVESTITAIQDLNSLSTTSGINKNTQDKALIKAAQLKRQFIEQVQSTEEAVRFAEQLGSSPEELFSEIVYYSGLHDNQQFMQTGKHLTDEAKDNIKEELKNIGAKLGLSKDQIQKTTDEVQQEVRFGTGGYITYSNAIKSLTAKLEDIQLNEEERTTLEDERKGWIKALLYFARYEADKLQQFANAFTEIATDPNATESTFGYEAQQGKGFTVYARDITNNSFTTGKGVYGVINNLNSSLNAMNNIIQRISPDLVEEVKTLAGQERSRYDFNFDKVTNAMSQLQRASVAVKNKLAKQEQAKEKEKEQSISNKVKKVFTKSVTAGEQLTLVEPSTVDKDKTSRIVKLMPNAIRSNISTPNSSKYTTLLNTLRSLSDAELIDVENKVSKSRSKMKQQMVDLLTEIKQQRTEVEQTTKQITEEDNKVINEVNTLLEKYSEIEDTDKALKDAYVELGKVAEKLGNTLIEESNEVKTALVKKIKSIQKQYTDLQTKKSDITAILDPETNKSVLLGTSKNDTDDLRNELELRSNKIECLLFTGLDAFNEDIQQEVSNWKSAVNKIFASIAMTPSDCIRRMKDGRPYNPLTTLFKFILPNAPHWKLLYNITVNDNTFDLQLNEQTALAIAFSVEEFIADSARSSMFEPTSKYNLAATFSTNENDLTASDLQAMRSFISKYGIPTTNVADKLGKMILHNMGLYANKNGTLKYYERMASGLGLVAIEYMRKTGLIVENKFVKSDDTTYSFIKSKSLNTIALSKNTNRLKLIQDKWKSTEERTGWYDKFKKVDLNTKAEPRIEVGKPPKDMVLRNTNGMAKVNKYVHSVISKLWNTSYEIDLDIVDFINKDENTKQAVLKRLGYLTDEERVGLSLDDSASAEGVNTSVESQLNYLLEFADRQRTHGDKWYFNWFQSRNGRLFIDSNTLNPQTGKALQRFLCLPSKMKRTFDSNNVEHLGAEYFAIAQAFDSLGTDEDIRLLGEAVNNLSLEDILKMRDNLVNMSEKEFKNTYKNLYINSKGNSAGLEGIENFGQCLNVLQHLIRKKEANGKLFETWLAVENDSTTSGYFIRFLQFPHEEVLSKFENKVGIVEEHQNKELRKTIHVLKKSSGFTDIYKTMAKAMAERLPKTAEERIFNYRLTYNKADDNYITLLSTMYDLMDNALPKPNTDGSVSKALRTLMKSPAMIFGYTAGDKAIKRKLADEIMLQFIKDYMLIKQYKSFDDFVKANSIKDTTEYKSRYETMEYISKLLQKTRHEDLYSVLKTKSVKDIWFKINNKNMNLEMLFQEVLNPIYGDAMWNSLEASFSKYTDYNTTLNQMFVSAFTMFNSVYEHKLNVLENKYGVVTIKEHEQLLQELQELMPSLGLVYDPTDYTEGMLILGMQKQTTDSRVQNPVKGVEIVNNKNVPTMKFTSTNANIKKFVNAGKAGAVLPIHFLDGMGMTLTLEEYPNNIPVHDAVVMSALDNKSITKAYNRNMALLCKQYDLYNLATIRFKNIVDAYDKLVPELNKTRLDNPLPLFKNMVVQDAYNNVTRTNYWNATKLEVPYGQHLLTLIDHLNAENKLERNAFFNQSLYIANMDGIEDSGVTIEVGDSLNTEKFVQAANDALGSGPYGYQTYANTAKIVSEANESVEGRLKVFDLLQKLAEDSGNIVLKDNRINYFKDIVKRINPNALKDIVVSIEEGKDFNAAMLDGTNIVIGFEKEPLSDDLRFAPMHDKSPAELYAHELIHAGLRFGLANKDIFNLDKLVSQLTNVYTAAMDVVTWEDFMPDVYNQDLKTVYEQQAKDIYNYIFNNSDTSKNLRGLHEFCAYGLTNEKLMNKLKSLDMPAKRSIEGKISVLDRLISTAKAIFDIVFGTGKTKESINTLVQAIKGEISLRQKRTMYAELDRLVAKISANNTKAGRKLFNHPLRNVEFINNAVAWIKDTANPTLSKGIRFTFNILDEVGLTTSWTNNISDTRWTKFTNGAKLLAGFVLSSSRRHAFREWLIAMTRISHQSTMMTILRDFSEPDLQTSRLEQLITLTRSVEQSSKALEASCFNELSEKFGRPLAEDEAESLTQTLLFTDLQCLYDGSNYGYIKKLITEDDFIAREINRTKESLKENENYNWMRNQALGLAYYMVTGIGNECQNLNAENIAKGIMSGKTKAADKALTDKINKLATLYALNMIAPEIKAKAMSLENAGLEHMLKIHQTFVKETKDGVVVADPKGNPVTVQTLNSIHAIKGYTKSLLDSTYDIKIDLLTNKHDLAKEGYVLIRELQPNNITKNSNLGVYRRTFAAPERRDGAGFIIAGANTIGTSLKESAYQMANNLDDSDNKLGHNIHSEYLKNATVTNIQIQKAMHSKELTIDDLKNLSGGYTPILNEHGMISDYRITMSNEHKVSDLGRDMNGLHILSKMYASQNTKANATIRNRVLIKFLEFDALGDSTTEGNMDLSTKRHRFDKSIKYIPLNKATANKYLKDSWQCMPKELLETIEEYKINNKEFYVREDWLQSLLGVPTGSLTDLEVISKYTNKHVKFSIRVAEAIMKCIAYLSKQNTIIRTPAVLIGNLVSNFNYSVMSGTNPVKVAKMQFENAVAIRDYINTKKELNKLEFRSRIGTATTIEKQKIGAYKAKLEHSTIHPLMKKGMYQAIVEDLNTDELENVGKIQKFIKNTKLAKKTPAAIRWILKQAYMTEGTPFYDFMFTLTQYSDFVARATEYQLRMAKAPNRLTVVTKNGKKVQEINPEYIRYEEQVSIDVWNTFINYDKPQSTLEQYLNDMGLMMYTKFFKRIQHVISKSVVNNPMGVLLFSLSQAAIYDSEDILEQNIFSKNFSSLFYNPINNFIDAVAPITVQYATGMRNLSL